MNVPRPYQPRVVDTWVTSLPDITHGTPCFGGTRVAIQSLFDHLETGYTIDGFLAEFPTVKREQVLGLFEQLRRQTAPSA